MVMHEKSPESCSLLLLLDMLIYFWRVNVADTSGTYDNCRLLVNVPNNGKICGYIYYIRGRLKIGNSCKTIS